MCLAGPAYHNTLELLIFYSVLIILRYCISNKYNHSHPHKVAFLMHDWETFLHYFATATKKSNFLLALKYPWKWILTKAVILKGFMALPEDTSPQKNEISSKKANSQELRSEKIPRRNILLSDKLWDYESIRKDSMQLPKQRLLVLFEMSKCGWEGVTGEGERGPTREALLWSSSWKLGCLCDLPPPFSQLKGN